MHEADVGHARLKTPPKESAMEATHPWQELICLLSPPLLLASPSGICILCSACSCSSPHPSGIRRCSEEADRQHVTIQEMAEMKKRRLEAADARQKRFGGVHVATTAATPLVDHDLGPTNSVPDRKHRAPAIFHFSTHSNASVATAHTRALQQTPRFFPSSPPIPASARFCSC